MHEHDHEHPAIPGAVIEVLDEGPCQKRMKVEIPAAAISHEIDENYAQLRKNLNLPGFRPGHVPRALLEKRYATRVEDEVREGMIHNTFHGEVERRSLQVLGQPTFDSIEFKVGEPLRYQSVFEVAPSFDLPNYEGLEIDARAVEVTEEEVERELAQVREQLPIDDALAFGEQRAGDIAVIDIRLIDGSKELLHAPKRHLQIGEDRVDNISMPGLAEKLVTAREGDDLRFEVTLPQSDVREDLRGAHVEACMRVLSVYRRRLPDLDDEFARGMGLDDLADLRGKLRRRLELRHKVEEEVRQERDLLGRLAAQVDMGLPPSILEARKRVARAAAVQRMLREGKSREEAQQLADASADLEDEARRELKQTFVLDQIAERERIFVTEDEIFERIGVIAASQNRTPEDVLEDYRRLELLPDLRSEMLRDKTRRFLRERAKINTLAAPERP